MPKIFISYRRADSTAETGRIYDRLVQAFGLDDVFKDVNDILGGHDFRQVLGDEVSRCDVLLVIIGPQWASITDDSGQPRLHNPSDFVRIEVESGLKRDDVLVIPVLVDNATLPTKEELPESLHDLVFRNAMTARNDPDFDGDMRRLIGQLRAHVKTLEDPPRFDRRSVGAIAVVLILIAVLGVVLLLTGGDKDDPDDTSESAGVVLSPTPTDPAVAEDTPTPTESSNKTPVALDSDTITLARTTVYSEPRPEASLIASAISGTFNVTGYNEDNTWIEIQLRDTVTGWVEASLFATPPVKVYFSRPESDVEFENYVDEVAEAIVDSIDETESTIDLAAFQFDNEVLTEAIINAHERGVQVRIVVDDEHGAEDEDSTISAMVQAGIEVVDDDRSGLMHNSFMILDGRAVWAGNSSFTINSTIRNNTSSIYFESEDLASVYTTEFEEMFEEGLFGPNSPANSGDLIFAGDIPVQVFFAPEDDVLEVLNLTLDTADRNIKFMMFSFSNGELGAKILDLAQTKGIEVQGVVETTGSNTRFSQMPLLRCNGLDIRTDGNAYVMNHKFILIDGETVVAMSSSLSTSAMTVNDENIMIFTAPDIVAQYNAEFDTLWNYAEIPADVDCSTFEE